MGWANCGEDSEGRPIGYAHPATCDHPGCDAKIDRGLSYACGGMHGTAEFDCEKYFCGKHMLIKEIHPDDMPPNVGADGITRNQVLQLCFSCADAYDNTDNGKHMMMLDGLK